MLNSWFIFLENRKIKVDYFLEGGNEMIHFVMTLVVGGVLGVIAGLILNEEVPGGVTGNVVIGFLGSWLGEFVLGNLGPAIKGFYLIPSLIGALFCLGIYSLLADYIRRHFWD
jgi:uncharacterized membrane protein YeaQ/YmgE (transglycosylase-associated protein family)